MSPRSVGYDCLTKPGIRGWWLKQGRHSPPLIAVFFWSFPTVVSALLKKKLCRWQWQKISLMQSGENLCPALLSPSFENLKCKAKQCIITNMIEETGTINVMKEKAHFEQKQKDVYEGKFGWWWQN